MKSETACLTLFRSIYILAESTNSRIELDQFFSPPFLKQHIKKNLS